MTDTSCTYCGAHATDRDHVVPRSYKRNSGKPSWTTDWTVPSCRLCNMILAAHVILTVPTRARYLHDKYCTERYAKRFSKDELISKLRHLSRVSYMPDDYMEPPVREDHVLAKMPRKSRARGNFVY